MAEQLRHAGFHVAALAAVVGLGRVLGQQPRGLDPGRHVGKLDLDCLVLADRLAKRLAMLGIAERRVQGRSRNTNPAGGDVDATERKPGEDLLQAPALCFADEIRGRYADVVELHLAGVDAAVAELGELAGFVAVGFFDDQQAHAAVPRLDMGIGFYQHGEHVALDRVGDPLLGAGHDVIIAVASGARPHRLQVGAAVGLGQRDATAQLAAGQARQKGLLLRLAGEASRWPRT